MEEIKKIFPNIKIFKMQLSKDKYCLEKVEYENKKI